MNNEGERFMARYAPQSLDLAPRHIVAVHESMEIGAGGGCEGGGVDPISAISVRSECRNASWDSLIAMDFAGIDPVSDPIPITARSSTMRVDCGWPEGEWACRPVCGRGMCLRER